MAQYFDDILESKRILVCVGSGGVGKTTTAAALALDAARRGKRTLVLTIDPAKRLANSLGLRELDHDVRQVPIENLGDVLPGGELFAMMLDQKRAFDEVVEHHASDPEAVKRILANPVYAQISSTLAGSQEYAALAKLQQFDLENAYDLIVVDTPPTANALDFLDAPQKLTQAIDSPAVEWFRKLRGGGGWSVVGRTGSYMLKRLSKFVGARFLDDLAVFFTEFNDVLGGFRLRAEETFGLLRTDRVGFVLVASPEPMAMREAVQFYRRLQSASMPLAGFVINKVHVDLEVQASSVAEVQELLAQDENVAQLGYQPSTLKVAADALASNHRDLQILARADRVAVDALRKTLEQGTRVVELPFFERDIYDLSRLGVIGALLTNRASRDGTT